MSQKKDCCIVIPAFNEGINISKNIENLLKSEIDIIIVDDGSTDDTSSKIINHNIIVITHPSNLGYDKAIETGFKKALELNYKYVITFDADGQHDYRDIDIFYNKLKEGNKLVIGKRMNFQRFGEYVFALYSKKIYKISDPLCGFKGYDIEIYKKNGCFDSFNSIGTELMFYCLNYNYKFCEVSISINQRQDNSKFGGIFKSNFKIIIALIKTVYFNFLIK